MMYLDLVEIADVIPPASDDGNFTFVYEPEEDIESVWLGNIEQISWGIHSKVPIALLLTFN